jgi:hypothetical protein
VLVQIGCSKRTTQAACKPIKQAWRNLPWGTRVWSKFVPFCDEQRIRSKKKRLLLWWREQGRQSHRIHLQHSLRKRKLQPKQGTHRQTTTTTATQTRILMPENEIWALYKMGICWATSQQLTNFGRDKIWHNNCTSCACGSELEEEASLGLRSSKSVRVEYIRVTSTPQCTMKDGWKKVFCWVSVP